MHLLPIFDVTENIVTALKQFPQVLLHAPTGAGKSTALPLYLLQQNLFDGKIILLEPRRIAAKSIAYRLANQLNEEVGNTVGYRMKAESKVSSKTRLEVVTEGVLNRMLQQDPELSGVSLVILDEFHERSLQADLALALLLDVQMGLRDDLRVLIMSATLDNQKLTALLPDAPMISAEGRSYPVERAYFPINPHQPFEQEIATMALRLLAQEAGSMLIFLPGSAEIVRVADILKDKVDDNVLLFPLYGALSLAEQQKAIEPTEKGYRKVVLATNIAETSLTIEGIRLVLDSAIEKRAQFDLKSGVTSLLRQRISQSSQTQRAGRAGRLEAGICWHLISQEQAERVASHQIPEILASDLSSLWLSVLQWGCRDINQLSWLDTPTPQALHAAKDLLHRLGAIDKQGGLTPRGSRMAQWGIEPRLAAILDYASEQSDNHLATAARLCAILEEPPRGQEINLEWIAQQKNIFWSRREKQLSQHGKGMFCPELLGLLLAVGFPDRIAKNRDNQGRFRLANGQGAMMDDRHSISDTPWILAPLLLQNAHYADVRILLALPIDIDEISATFPELIENNTTVEWDEKRGTLVAWQQRQLGRLTISQRQLDKPNKQQMQQALLNWLRDNGLNALALSEETQQLFIRLALAKKWCPEVLLPDLAEAVLLETLETWLLPELGEVQTLKALQQIDINTIIKNQLTWHENQLLQSLFPTHYLAPTGTKVIINYDLALPPVIAIRIQEVYGEQQSPIIANGQLPVIMELLSPAHRPIQKTQDLATFWAGSYKEVQKEMKGRYPKHLWPDDPANTAPTRRVKKYSQ
ncbi:ATP-dependent helicase HrpB [Proteus appendicitidis]|uniref:ATP-dependent helicase HrpB n=1 Tax=Proteus appendicitidis TaxID=3034648 RepID=A0ABY8YBC5_9GAMM|nr:ATP-dependent helicase HrpB [Proteus sp. HZ0627]WIV89227.1 ATP-dependent helicase HrpB [Proteus sp. HZ0627]